LERETKDCSLLRETQASIKPLRTQGKAFKGLISIRNRDKLVKTYNIQIVIIIFIMNSIIIIIIINKIDLMNL
jgi:hypothetical protein